MKKIRTTAHIPTQKPYVDDNIKTAQEASQESSRQMAQECWKTDMFARFIHRTYQNGTNGNGRTKMTIEATVAGIHYHIYIEK